MFARIFHGHSQDLDGLALPELVFCEQSTTLNPPTCRFECGMLSNLFSGNVFNE